MKLKFFFMGKIMGDNSSFFFLQCYISLFIFILKLFSCWRHLTLFTGIYSDRTMYQSSVLCATKVCVLVIGPKCPNSWALISHPTPAQRCVKCSNWRSRPTWRCSRASVLPPQRLEMVFKVLKTSDWFISYCV